MMPTTPRRTSRQAVLVAALVAALWLIVLTTPDARAAGYGKNKVQTDYLEWQVLNTPHFRIHYHDDAEELAVRAALICERTYKEYSDRLDRDLPWPVPFILYNSHADFAQTNISDRLIGEGTGGFSEPLRNRVVLPYNGSHADFVHVIRHEIVHAFMFHMAFGKSTSMAQTPFFHIPLWFAEGIAEWFSSGWDAEADMFIRDATINDYLYPLEQVGGFMVYKQGQAAMAMLADLYGPAKLVDFWWRVGRARSVERALAQVYGLRLKDLNRLYRQQMRRRYWPRYSELELVEEVARPLTDHREEGTYLNEMPALSPNGDKVVYFSDREGLVDLWLMSAIDGRVIRRLGRSRRSAHFETFHSFKSGLTFSPDGREIALIARSGNYETLHTIDIGNGDVTRSIRLGLDVAVWPVWSPRTDAIALAGTRTGRTDLYLVDLDGELDPELVYVEQPEELADGALLVRLTDDAGDEATPAWAPDGRSLAFVHNPLAEVEYEFSEDLEGNRRLEWARPVNEDTLVDPRLAPGGSVERLDLTDGTRVTLFERDQDVREPQWLDDRTLAVVHSAGDIDNLAVARLAADGQTVVELRDLTNLLGGVSHLSWSPRADRLVFSAFHAAGYDLYAADSFLAEWSQRQPQGESPPAAHRDPPEPVVRTTQPEPVAEPDKVGLVEDYSPSLSMDLSQSLAGGSVYYNPAVGLGMANVVTLSDLLGDHRARFLINFYGALDNSDLSASYSYLKRRIDYGGGVFHYSNYYNSVFTGVGELLSRQTKFRERNYGIFGYASYPLDTFRRFDFELQYLNSDRTDYRYMDGEYILLAGQRTLKRLLQPTLSFTSDTALYGLHGPVAGSRWILSTSRTVSTSSSSLDRFTTVFDFRKYWLPWRRNSFALHLSVAGSDGDDPRAFVLGGPWTLRGYKYYDYQTIDNLAGTKMALLSLEYRLPMVDYLIFGWPGRWGLTGVGAVTYIDLGSAWNHQVQFFGKDDTGHWGMRDLRGNFGVGLRANILFFPMKFDWAWKTDLRRVEDVTFQFSIGPEF